MAGSGTRGHATGILTAPATQSGGNTTAAQTPKPSLPRMKVMVRRLAPGLTETEFLAALGNDWRSGNGKVDWFLYLEGKVSQDISKPSRPARAYFHLKNNDSALALADHIKQTTFEDAKNTHTSSVLLGPPVLEFAPYGKTPMSKQRNDARSGTIDQDPEFMQFLEGLANPDLALPNTSDPSGALAKPEKGAVTPLVQYLKDKKANKSKEAAAKATKKIETKSKSKEDVKNKPKDPRMDKQVEKAAKEAVKILNREAGTKASGSGEMAPSTNVSNAKPDPEKANTSRKAAIAAHARLVQRDLGLVSSQSARNVKKEDRQSTQGAKPTTKAAESTTCPPTGGSPAKKVNAAPTAPRAAIEQSKRKGIAASPKPARSQEPATAARAASPKPTMQLLKKSDEAVVAEPALTVASSPSTEQKTPKKDPQASQSPQAPVASPTTRSAKGPITPRGAASQARKSSPTTMTPPNTRQAFVKHANSSQGVTEPLLKTALEAFGAITFIEVDRRKGFAYVDFAQEESLKKAMAGSPVNVAQGTVVVLPRRGTGSTSSATTSAPNVPISVGNAKPGGPTPTSKPGAPGRAMRGGSMRRGGRAAASARPPLPAATTAASTATGSIAPASTTKDCPT